MTNQQLKAHCEDVIANPQDHLDWVVDMARVTLASLEAVTVAYVHPAYLQAGALGFDASIGRLAPAQVALYTAPPATELKAIDFEEDEAALEKGVSALIDCLEDCGDAEQGLRLALRAMTGVE